MSMKYIVVDYGYSEDMIIFPSTTNHKDMAEKFKDFPIVSAGFVKYDDCVTLNPVYCYGESTTLHLTCRKERDNFLLRSAISSDF